MKVWGGKKGCILGQGEHRGKDCHIFGCSTCHKHVQAGQGKLVTHTWRWGYSMGVRWMKGWLCQARVWCMKSKPCRRCHHTFYNAVMYFVRGNQKKVCRTHTWCHSMRVKGLWQKWCCNMGHLCTASRDHEGERLDIHWELGLSMWARRGWSRMWRRMSRRQWEMGGMQWKQGSEDGRWGSEGIPRMESSGEGMGLSLRCPVSSLHISGGGCETDVSCGCTYMRRSTRWGPITMLSHFFMQKWGWIQEGKRGQNLLQGLNPYVHVWGWRWGGSSPCHCCASSSVLLVCRQGPWRRGEHGGCTFRCPFPWSCCNGSPWSEHRCVNGGCHRKWDSGFSQMWEWAVIRHSHSGVDVKIVAVVKCERCFYSASHDIMWHHLDLLALPLTGGWWIVETHLPRTCILPNDS